ncbi:MAG: cystathionine beta-lyase [bacterium]
MPDDALTDQTKLIASGREKSDKSHMVNPAIERGSTVLFPDYKTFRDRKKPFFYGRMGTPTHRALEQTVCALEGAEHAMLTPSGLAAVIVPILALSKPGSHILVTDNAYDPVRGFCQNLAKQYGIETEFYDPCLNDGIEALIGETTTLILAESPGSLTFEVQDIPAMAKIAHKNKVNLLVDNSWAAGYFFKPLAHGADISIQAATKYPSGHSDAMSGFMATNDSKLADRIERTRRDLGYAISADEAALVHRGLRSMAARLPVHMSNGLALAQWLEQRQEVAKVLHPALSSHPQHDLWKRDFSGATGLFAVLLAPVREEQLERFFNRLELFGMGYSWGGYESLCIPTEPVYYRTACPWQEEGQLLRIHAGLEDVKDLQADLDRAFAAMTDGA